MSVEKSSRRDFLTGEAWQLVPGHQGTTDLSTITQHPPSRGPSLVLRTQAMATDFDVILNPAQAEAQLKAASCALDLVHEEELRLSSYRADSEVARINQMACESPQRVSEELATLLQLCAELFGQTEEAFDVASGALIRLWRLCRSERRLPEEDELKRARAASGMKLVHFDPSTRELSFARPGVELHFGAIGKGYALDRMKSWLIQQGVRDALIHGGKSSVSVWGEHAGRPGWPIGLNNPLFPDRPLLTLLLHDAALGTSGTAVQAFRYQGRRYGHIIDPRTGWPADAVLSVTVVAPTAALADALSTACYVLGLEKGIEICHHFPDVGAIFFPQPRGGQLSRPVVIGIPPSWIFWHASD
ncbi:MAG: FAD:protein FMN transferase [Planctomycetaceae bacterium]|nr:MAG: FAD:protein FMN transferase [Planctomycetaceae bacterium]